MSTVPSFPTLVTPQSPPTPPVSEPIPSSIPPELPKASPKWIIIGIILLLLAAISIFAYKLILTNKVTTPPEPTPTASAQPTPTPQTTNINPSPTTDPTASWKTYTNNIHNFIIKYPQDIGPMKENISDNTNKPLYTIRNNYLADNPDTYAVEVAVWDNPDKKELLGWLGYMKDSQALPLPSTNYKLSTNYQVGGVEAMKYWEDPVSNGEKPGKCFQTCPATNTYFVKGNKAFRVLVVFYTEVDENLSKLPDLILSTFRFLEPTDPRGEELKSLDTCVPTTERGANVCYAQKTKGECLKMATDCRWAIAVP